MKQLIEFVSTQEFGLSDNNEPYQLGQFQFFPSQRLLVWPDNTVSLTCREADLLQTFIANPNQLLDRCHVLMQVWGSKSLINVRVMDVYVSRLRKLLSCDRRLSIVNVYGSGYMLLVKK